MSPRKMLRTFKQRQQQLDREVASSSPAKRKIKRKNLLHGCKLCPEKNFPVSAQSKTRPGNPSVEGHVEKEHPGMNYRNLTRKWGYRVHYEDETVEIIPLIEHGDVEEEEKRAKARYTQEQGCNFDQDSALWQNDKNLYMVLSGGHPAVENGHEGSLLDSSLPKQNNFATPATQARDNMDQQSTAGFTHHNLTQTDNGQHEANTCQEANASSSYLDLPVLDLQQAQVEVGNILGPIISGDQACTSNLNDAFDENRVNNISPFDPNDPFGIADHTPIDPRLTPQGELTPRISSYDGEQTQAQSATQVAGDKKTIFNHCVWLPDRTQLQNTAEGTLPVRQYQTRLDGQDSFPSMSNHETTEFESFQKPLVNRTQPKHVSHNFHASSQISNMPQAIHGDQRQLFNSTCNQSFPHGKPTAEISSPDLLQNGHGTLAYPEIPIQNQSVSQTRTQRSVPQTPPHQSPSPFKMPSTPASASHPAAKRSRSSQSLAKQYSLVKDHKTPTSSPQKRKTPPSNPQTPTPKSRRSSSSHSTTASPQLPNAPQPQPQPSVSPTPHYAAFTQPGPSSTPLQYHSAGPLVFTQVNFSQLHTLDREALTGHHGQLVANLARLAFFGNNANHPATPRTREKQMMDMVGYLRLQREWLYGGGRDRGGDLNGVEGSGM